jgi:hypothetical protein
VRPRTVGALTLTLGAMGDRDEGRRTNGSETGDRGDARSRPIAPARADISGNAAGLGAAFEAARRRQDDGQTAARSWEVGAKGERAAGEMLMRLTAVAGGIVSAVATPRGTCSTR